MSKEDLEEELINTLYDFYELENSMDNIRYIHPMFYNGTFSENNEYQPPKPDPLMSKEDFTTMLNTTDTEWNKVIEVLAFYILRQNKDE
ncbi:MAG: hypothetical protein GTO02_10430 [Candidatus Dadabacteria bacterium]|nr:hypothetical protein [Candidatus Dadabacteria bacterium]